MKHELLEQLEHTLAQVEDLDLAFAQFAASAAATSGYYSEGEKDRFRSISADIETARRALLEAAEAAQEVSK